MTSLCRANPARPPRFAVLAFLIVLLASAAWAAPRAAHVRTQAEPVGARSAPTQGPAIDLDVRIGDMKVEHGSGDRLRVRVPGRGRLTPRQFARTVYREQQRQRSHGWLFVVFNITSWWGVAWVCVGLGGQVLFTGRMVVQWLISEKEQRSVVPVAFWWMSLIGASMLLIYFIWRKDIVGGMGQATGWLIYLRNLYLIYVSARRARQTRSRSSRKTSPSQQGAA